MMQHTTAQKEAIKEAKKAFKQAGKQKDKEREETRFKYTEAQRYIEENKSTFILTGILSSERLMELDEPVYGDYFYVSDEEAGKVFRSNLFRGTVRDLIRNRRSYDKECTKIYTCDMLKRNLLHLSC